MVTAGAAGHDGRESLIPSRAVEAIESSDTDELLRVVDGLCEAKEWERLVELKDRCREAVTRGKQLWGVEEHIRYRLALEAPPAFAGSAVSEGPLRFGLGPLPEVAASTKTWEELEPHLDAGPWRDVVKAERAVRGEAIGGSVADIPSERADWEPDYPTAIYKSDKLEAPSPRLPELSDATLPSDYERIEDPASSGVLSDLVEPWVTQSNGRAQVSVVEGDALAAIRALGLTRARVGRMTDRDALAWLAWAAASGGAHGARRGAAAGRHLVWWLLMTLCDLDWPLSPADGAAALSDLDFYWFDDGSPASGWVLRMAIEHGSEGIAWAISAVDVAD